MTNLGREVNGETTGSLTISSIADTWVVVRTHEQNIERIHTIQIIKSRGMPHSNQLREFEFSAAGLRTIQPYIGVDGVHIGSARVAVEARDHMNRLEKQKAVEARHAQLAEKQQKLTAQIAAMQAEHDAEAREIEAEYQAFNERQDTRKTAIQDIRKERGV
jgi:circadian clock protein KaiC